MGQGPLSRRLQDPDRPIWPVSDRDCGRRRVSTLDFRLFGRLQCVVDLYSQPARGTLKLGMSQEELNSPEVLCAPVDQGRFVQRSVCVPYAAGSRPTSLTLCWTIRAY
jgi:hypothetical protein